MAESESQAAISLQALRKAIRANEVVFPLPVPIFACQHRPDIQWRLVELYFVHGWSCAQLGERYEVTDRRIQQLIQRWVSRAKAVGYLQVIPAADSELEVAAAAGVDGFAPELAFDIREGDELPAIDKAGACATP